MAAAGPARGLALGRVPAPAGRLDLVGQTVRAARMARDPVSTRRPARPARDPRRAQVRVPAPAPMAGAAALTTPARVRSMAGRRPRRRPRPPRRRLGLAMGPEMAANRAPARRLALGRAATRPTSLRRRPKAERRLLGRVPACRLLGAERACRAGDAAAARRGYVVAGSTSLTLSSNITSPSSVRWTGHLAAMIRSFSIWSALHPLGSRSSTLNLVGHPRSAGA